MSGIDNYDWSVFGGNPAPGDPDGVRVIATRLRDLADGVRHQNSLLQSVGSASHSVWEGPAANAFRPHLDKLPGQLNKLTTSYRDAADGLDGYWPRLAAAQRQAVDAWHKAKNAQGQVQTAQAQVSHADQAASTAADTYNHAVHTAATAPPDPSGATAAHLSSLQTAYQNASNQLSSAHNALNTANANLDAAHALADSARSHAKAAAKAAANALHAASEAGIHNPHHSLFSSIVDDIAGVVSDGLHWAEHHIGDVAAVALVGRLGPLAVLISPEARHLISEVLHTVEPGLKVFSELLGATSAVLAVAGLVLAPIGIGELIDVVNEGVMGLKTADDALLVAAGDKEAVSWLAEDAVGMATAGAGRVVGDTADALAATGKARVAAREAEEADTAVASAESRVASAGSRAAAAEQNAARAGSDSELLRSMASEARAEGKPFNAVSLNAQADAKLGEQASASAAGQAARQTEKEAQRGLDQATANQAAADKALSNANAKVNEAKNLVNSRTKVLKSFVGGNNWSSAKVFSRDVWNGGGVPNGLETIAEKHGVTGGYLQNVARVYGKELLGTPGWAGRTGAALHVVKVGGGVAETSKAVDDVKDKIEARIK